MAFLKRIEAKGFKSFAHKTIIKFTDGLIIIVGPNGSGKSNINDAIKWVLGEISKKTLRASSSSDMIFTGSEKERAADMAEVTLVFNNEDKILDINYSEVSITRRSYRHQDHNEYYINKNLVRRKDIKNLFLDTGLGNTDLSIISQGSVSKVTSAKPDDLKDLLNEAAGVARYQQQKTESIKKLEKVNQNLEIFVVKLKEMDRQISPLKKAKEKAEKYLSIKENLEEIELPIIKEQLQIEINRREELQEILSSTETEKNTTNEKLEDLKEKQHFLQQKVLKYEEELVGLQTKQSELATTKISDFGDTIKDLEAQIKETTFSISDVTEILSEANEKEKEAKNKLISLRDKEFEIGQEKEKIQYRLNALEYELNKFSSSNYDKLGRGTRVILENKAIFNEIYGMVSELISYNDKFANAINISLGNKLSNIVVSDEKVIKHAIKFLKENKYGNATFIPADKVKEKFISEEYLAAIENIEGFLGTLDSLIKTKSTFKRVVSSLAGNILVFENINLGLKAANLIGYKFMIVTLDGDIIFPGFIVRGGYNSGDSDLSKKDQLINETEKIRVLFKKIIGNQKKAREDVQNQLSLVSQIENEQVRAQERITYLETNLRKLLDQFELKTGKSFNLEKIKGVKRKTDSLSLEQIKNRIKIIQTEKQKYQKDLIELQKREDEFRNIWQTSIETNTQATLEFNKIDTNIKINLEILNRDYKMTWEALEIKEVPKLKINYDKATELRQKYREEINELGYIDIDAIERYNQIATDYEDLKENTEDLQKSREKLLSTIDVMDEKMNERLEMTFDEVNKKFQFIFETLFRGGTAEIIFSDPENILESGIEMVVKAPGKKIKNINLYSGGEKSMIALSLILAITEVRKLPLLLLDEVEAALDESNVERFAKFIKQLNSNTQLIVVTHRPGTMEKADILYGVTMEEKGVTKIVSVKLEEAVELAT